MHSYQTYLLALPSGGLVEVRQPHPLLALGHSPLLSPLLAAAAGTVAQEESGESRRNPLTQIYGTTQSALVDPEVRSEDLPLADLLSIYAWVASSAIAPAVPYSTRTYTSTDLLAFVTGQGAILVDAVSARYAVRPSTLLGFEDAPFSIDLDVAVGYRGLCRERAPDRDEVEAEDVFGNIHKIPAAWQRTEPGRMIRTDDIARDMAKHGIREAAFSAGGAIGCNPGQELGDFNRFRQ